MSPEDQALFNATERDTLRREQYEELNPVVLSLENWEMAVRASSYSTQHHWAGGKFADSLKDHLSKYPGFNVVRMAEYFVKQRNKAQLAYTDIAALSKRLKRDRSWER